MKQDQARTRPVQLLAYIGAALFLVALLGSALLVPDLRLLHAFQALIYVAVIVLVQRDSLWGYGAGFSVALVWNAMGIFVTHLITTGAAAFWFWLRTGQLHDLVPMMVTLGGIGHTLLIIAALLALFARGAKWWRFASGAVLSVAYFALIVSFAQPH